MNLKTLSRKDTVILTALGIVCSGVAIYKAYKNGPKIRQIIDETKGAPIKEKVFNVAKAAAPVIIFGGLSAACHITAQKINYNRYQALLTTCAASKSLFDEYSEHVRKEIGEGKEKKIINSIMQDRANAVEANENSIINFNTTGTLCYEPISKQYFEGDIESVRKAINDANQQILQDGYISVNEYLDKFDLPPLREGTGLFSGDDFGWGVFQTGIIDIVPDSIILTDGRPCFTFFHRVMPSDRYQNTW